MGGNIITLHGSYPMIIFFTLNLARGVDARQESIPKSKILASGFFPSASEKCSFLNQFLRENKECANSMYPIQISRFLFVVFPL